VITLSDAMQKAEERKRTVFGDPPQGELRYSDGEQQDRLIMGGFDLDYEELTTRTLAVADFFVGQIHQNTLATLFSSCWVDGLLTGMIYARMVDKEDG
jgi:hypothetical protein